MNANKAKWVRLGDYIEQCDERNAEGIYTIEDAMGMTITKEIIPTKANLQDNDLYKFLVVNPKEFVYNPRTHGKKIGLGFNNTEKPFIISWNNVAFRVKDSALLLPDYLYIIICREEWDRNTCFRSWGSSTEVFSWNEFSLMEIPLPSIDIQQELVDTYNGLKSLAEQNEALIEPLSKVCEAFVSDCQSKYPQEELGKYIEVFDKRNTDGNDYLFYGINKDKTFMPTVADTNNLDSSKYKVVNKGDFVFSGMQTGRDICIRIALYNVPCIIVDIIPANAVFFHRCGYAVILFPLVEATVFDDVDMVFGILDFAIYDTGRDYMAMHKRTSGIFAHAVDFFHLLRTNPFLDIVSRFVLGKESVN